ncbi:energy-coupling factor transporter transmembrane protein EcfT [Cellulomonas sp. C5510]|uniref:energy-coupling factor transporter transmembrane component T family protein n=1 Tax=Cellulomonas sp. C5510 TaxID=2871170 RepID=UPI001C961E83|nr:energy-coupling factor transporter transmembrane component T [Cellulomonas sp. C5510]QZN86567.1 energy-coupling factor transporter transmembrane protein EcfT [Cellulomonas sp. C5510]
MSPLEARNPAVKLLLVVAVSVATLALLDPRTLAVLYLLGLVAARWGAGVGPRRLLLAQVPFWTFGAGVLLVNALSRPGDVLAAAGPFRVTDEGLAVGAALALRGCVIGVATVAFLASTPPRDLMVSLVRHARLSPRYAYALLAGHRMLAGLPRQWATIRAAQAVRAPLRRDGRPREGWRGLGRSAFALLVASVRASERVALALESRGLSAGPRTVWRPVPLGAGDGALAAGVLGVVVVVVAAGAWSAG